MLPVALQVVIVVILRIFGEGELVCDLGFVQKVPLAGFCLPAPYHFHVQYRSPP